MIAVGVDVGTSGVKAIAVDAESGQVLAAHTEPLHSFTSQRPGWAEQDPEEYLDAAGRAMTALTGKLGTERTRVRAIGLTGQMHTAVLLDSQGKPVRPAILWCDGRTADACNTIRERIGAAKLATLVGNDAFEGFTLPKLLWLREHEPEVAARVHSILMPKDFIGFSWTGVLGADVSDAAGTLMLDIRSRRWSSEMLAAFDIPSIALPPVAESNEPLGPLRPMLAGAWGLRPDVVVIRGAADNAAAALGLGAVDHRTLLVSIGTSGTALVSTDAPAVDPSLSAHCFCHALPGKYYTMGVMLSAGAALRWYRDTLCDGEKMAGELQQVDPYQVIAESASTAPPGAGGVTFLPYLMGERTPHKNPDARAAWVGMDGSTNKAHMSRAVMEGITFGLVDCIETVLGSLEANGLPLPSGIRLAGGGAKSAFWRQLLADIAGFDVAVTTQAEGPSFGAAMLAAAHSFGASPEAIAKAWVHERSVTHPAMALRERYRDLHQEYRELYRALAPSFERRAKH